MPQNSPIRIGTRGSRLALAQAHQTRDLLAAQGLAADIVIIKTSGDRIQDRPLADLGGKGLFTKELEEALYADQIDLAVHSMKDVPFHLPPDMILAAVLPREAASDVLLSASAYMLETLPHGAVIGTSSVRRRAQLLRRRPDVRAENLRGNIDTRLAKLDSGRYVGVLLAQAGLNRLAIQDRPMQILDVTQWLPSPAQGVIGIEIRARDKELGDQLKALNHLPTEICLACERAFLGALDGSCRTPIAGLAQWDGSALWFHGEVLALDGEDFADIKQGAQISTVVDAAELGRQSGLSLRPRVKDWLNF